MEFLTNYDNWKFLQVEERKSTIKNFVDFYQEKTIEYITSHLKNKININKDKIEIKYVTSNDGRIATFGDNVVFVDEDYFDAKKPLFYAVAESTICAVFLHLFGNTASNPNKKTKFTALAKGYAVSITNEFSPSQAFVQDMMASMASELETTMEM